MQISASELNNNSSAGSFVDWDISNVSDAEYEIRLKIICGSGTTFTQRVRGIIDRIAPIVFGIPSPVDDVYNQSENDELSVAFEEMIMCSEASVTLQDLDSGEILDASISCAGNELVVTPTIVLDTRGPAAYRISLMEIKDVAGNTRAPYRWVFIVGDYIYDPDCSPIMISNNNENQDAISQSVYRSMEITSDGTVGGGSTIGYKAEMSVVLEPGFTVSEGGALEASIENCEN